MSHVNFYEKILMFYNYGCKTKLMYEYVFEYVLGEYNTLKELLPG